MATETKRATVYFDPQMHRALRIKAAATSRTVSDLVNEAVRLSLAEDATDLAAFEERKDEPLVSFEDVLKELKSMATYRIFLKGSAAKELKEIAKNDVQRIVERIGSLAFDPPGWQREAVRPGAVSDSPRQLPHHIFDQRS